MSDPAERAFRFTSAAVSDPGATRKFNEDSYVLRDDICLWAVADGVGGHEAGDIASGMLAESLGSLGPPAGGRSFLASVEDAIRSANDRLIEFGASRAGRPPGSTVACLVVYRGYVACIWVGDSRIYRLREGALKRLTKDHSYVQEMIDSGAITPDEARGHPNSNIITRAIGSTADLVIDVAREPLNHGDRFVVCSDGLTGCLTDDEIAALMANRDAPAAARALLDEALSRRARDNVTVIIVDT